MKSLADRLLEHASQAKVFAGDVSQLEAQLRTADGEVFALKDRLREADRRIEKLQSDLAQAELDEEIYEFIEDVRRGVRTLEELYERAVGL
jgi:chromosome segregation ATPase